MEEDNMRDCAPVIVFTYNRLDHTMQTLKALDSSPLAKETDIFIYCDNYKNQEAKEKVEAVRNFVDSFAKQSCFRTVNVIKAEKNKGLANSIIQGVTEIINRYGRAIVVEDDLLTDINFLRFMNSGLDYYENDSRIWALSGYSFPMKALENYDHDVFFTMRGCSWGWATWKDRWDTVDWEVKSYDSFKHNWIKRFNFAKWGRDLPRMLDYQMLYNINSWAIRWCYQAFIEKKYTVYPKKSLLLNLGTDGSGTHSSERIKKYDTIIQNAGNYECKFEFLEINESIRKEFKKIYSNGFWDDIKSEIKGMLIRIGIYKLK